MNERYARNRATWRRYYIKNKERIRAHRRTWTAEKRAAVSVSAKRYYGKNRESVKAKSRLWQSQSGERRAATSLMRKLGISLLVAERWIGVKACFSCGATAVRGSRRHHVDHNHKTGEIRGVLCNRCNVALGMARDNPYVLRALADYIESVGGSSNGKKTVCYTEE